MRSRETISRSGNEKNLDFLPAKSLVKPANSADRWTDAGSEPAYFPWNFPGFRWSIAKYRQQIPLNPHPMWPSRLLVFVPCLCVVFRGPFLPSVSEWEGEGGEDQVRLYRKRKAIRPNRMQRRKKAGTRKMQENRADFVQFRLIYESQLPFSPYLLLCRFFRVSAFRSLSLAALPPLRFLRTDFIVQLYRFSL